MIVWAAMSCNGLSDIFVASGEMDSEGYCNVLTLCLLPFVAHKCLEDWIFQQDNAPIHINQFTKGCFSDNFVDLLTWPAKSLDINFFENLRGILVREVYKGFRQLKDLEQLKKKDASCWSYMDDFANRNLYTSIVKRCVDATDRQRQIFEELGI